MTLLKGAAALSNPRWTKTLRIFKRALQVTLDDLGADLHPWVDGPTVRAVNKEAVRAEFYKAYPAEGETPQQRQEASRKAFNRAVTDALERNLICMREINLVQYLWMVTDETCGTK
jgi:hypothetical protein